MKKGISDKKKEQHTALHLHKTYLLAKTNTEKKLFAYVTQ
jgi:hypothetical protein